MATIKHYSGETELVYVCGLDNAKFAAKFPGVKGFRYDSFRKLVGVVAGVGSRTSEIEAACLPVTRRIEFKSNPSLHVCNAKCQGAKPNGACECSCRGKNHGLGYACESVAA